MINGTAPTIDYTGATVRVPLTKGQFAVIDEIDSDLLQSKWWAGQYKEVFYARKSAPRPIRKTIHMHRVILSRMLGRELEPNEFVDHIDCDGLNNRRSNLRLATKADNMRNQRRDHTNTSGFKGVTWSKDNKRWCAQIKVNRKRTHLGYFDDPAEAHEAYKKAAVELHGEFARFE